MALRKNPRSDLKARYHTTVQGAIIVVLVIIITAFNYFPKYQPKYESQDSGWTDAVIETIEPTQQKTEIPPEIPKPVIPIQKPDAEPLDIEFAPTEIEFDVEQGPPKQYEEKKTEPEAAPFYPFPEVGPEIIGGIKTLQEKVAYPELAVKAGIEGKVYIKAWIDETGNVYDAEVSKGIGAGCDEAALNAVKETKFKPAKQRNKPVKTTITIPVVFRLR